MVEVSAEEFEGLVAEALDSLPGDITIYIDNVVVLVQEEAPAEDPDLLGLYVGVPLTERGMSYAGSLPDQIFIYRRPLLEFCRTAEEVVEEVRITVVHEIAHHFGIDDRRLHELGYD